MYASTLKLAERTTMIRPIVVNYHMHAMMWLIIHMIKTNYLWLCTTKEAILILKWCTIQSSYTDGWPCNYRKKTNNLVCSPLYQAWGCQDVCSLMLHTWPGWGQWAAIQAAALPVVCLCLLWSESLMETVPCKNWTPSPQ